MTYLLFYHPTVIVCIVIIITDTVPSDLNTLNKFVSTECLQPNCRTCDEHIDICDVCNIGYMVEISGACTGNSLRYNIILVLGKQVNGDTLNRS